MHCAIVAGKTWDFLRRYIEKRHTLSAFRLSERVTFVLYKLKYYILYTCVCLTPTPALCGRLKPKIKNRIRPDGGRSFCTPLRRGWREDFGGVRHTPAASWRRARAEETPPRSHRRELENSEDEKNFRRSYYFFFIYIYSTSRDDRVRIIYDIVGI